MLQVTPTRRNPGVDPITPNPNERVSKRAFDAELKQWRKKLHSIEVYKEYLIWSDCYALSRYLQ